MIITEKSSRVPFDYKSSGMSNSPSKKTERSHHGIGRPSMTHMESKYIKALLQRDILDNPLSTPAETPCLESDQSRSQRHNPQNSNTTFWQNISRRTNSTFNLEDSVMHGKSRMNLQQFVNNPENFESYSQIVDLPDAGKKKLEDFKFNPLPGQTSSDPNHVRNCES